MSAPDGDDQTSVGESIAAAWRALLARTGEGACAHVSSNACSRIPPFGSRLSGITCSENRRTGGIISATLYSGVNRNALPKPFSFSTLAFCCFYGRPGPARPGFCRSGCTQIQAPRSCGGGKRDGVGHYSPAADSWRTAQPGKRDQAWCLREAAHGAGTKLSKGLQHYSYQHPA